MCRMRCHAPSCPAGQCAKRKGNCCDFECVGSSSSHNDGEFNDGANNDGGKKAPNYGGTKTLSEGDDCNESLPPQFQRRCDRDQGLRCVYRQGAGMGSSGKCAKGGSVSRKTVKLGRRCSTSRTRGNRGVITPCEQGATCKITDQGDMRVDRPNSGTCTKARKITGVGAKCVKGFSEMGISMPCKSGLTCVTNGNMCAGTCYGTCKSSGH